MLKMWQKKTYEVDSESNTSNYRKGYEMNWTKGINSLDEGGEVYLASI